MSLADITNKITKDARKEADTILAKAKEQAMVISERAAKKCDEIKTDYDERFEDEKLEIARRRDIVANLDVARMKLASERRLIDDVYAKALAKLCSLPREEYLKFSTALLRAAVSGDECITVGENEQYLDAEWLADFNKKYGTSLTFSPERGDFAGGFIASKNRVSKVCTWEMLLKVQREKSEKDVVSRLFSSEQTK